MSGKNRPETPPSSSPALVPICACPDLLVPLPPGLSASPGPAEVPQPSAEPPPLPSLHPTPRPSLDPPSLPPPKPFPCGAANASFRSSASSATGALRLPSPAPIDAFPCVTLLRRAPRRKHPRRQRAQGIGGCRGGGSPTRTLVRGPRGLRRVIGARRQRRHSRGPRAATGRRRLTRLHARAGRPIRAAKAAKRTRKRPEGHQGQPRRDAPLLHRVEDRSAQPTTPSLTQPSGRAAPRALETRRGAQSGRSAGSRRCARIFPDRRSWKERAAMATHLDEVAVVRRDPLAAHKGLRLEQRGVLETRAQRVADAAGARERTADHARALKAREAHERHRDRDGRATNSGTKAGGPRGAGHSGRR